jgi:lipoic acid synthetase
MGETSDELRGAIADLRNVGVDVLTLGQYLRPSRQHLPVARWWTPEEFAELGAYAEGLGFRHVEAGPLVRSSYHAKRATEPSPVN